MTATPHPELLAQHPEILIRNAYVITMDEDRRVFTDGYVAIVGGRFVAAGPMAQCPATAGRVIDARGRVLMPGMGNAHNHLVQVAFRGYNDDRWPVLDIPAAVRALLAQLFALADRLDAENTYRLVRLHMLDLLKNGYTATHDEHFINVRKDSVDGAWQAVAESGMRGFLARCIVSGERILPAGAEDVETGLAEAERLRTAFCSSRIEVVPGILNFHFLENPDDMRRIRAGANALGCPLDVDMTDNSRGAALRARGFSGGQVEYYQSFGVLDGPVSAGKAHALLPHEYELLARHDARVAMVPMLRFFDGFGLPLHHFLAQGVVPGLGTDAPLVSDCQNPFDGMRNTILAQNMAVRREVAEGLTRPEAAHWATAETVLEMATLGSARTLFMENVSGSITVGKAADCVLVDLDDAMIQPTAQNRRLPGVLVWAGQKARVDSVFVDGVQLLEDGRSTLWNEDEVVREAAQALDTIFAASGIADLLPARVPGQSFRGWSYQ